MQTLVSDKHKITLHIQNVHYAKENGLLWTKYGITHEMIQHNMMLCGFDFVSCGEHKSTKTKITVKCCKRPVTAIKGDERFEFDSTGEAAKQLNLSKKAVYHCARNGRVHKSSGWRFEYLD